jgi:hypothetical protein
VGTLCLIYDCNMRWIRGERCKQLSDMTWTDTADTTQT